MNNSDYQYINTILESGSITEASKKLFISQSALSQYIKRMETKLGIKIFDRNFQPLILTEAGEIYYKSLEEIMAIEEETLRQIEDLNNLKRGEVVVGSTDYLAYSLLSKVLKKFNKAYPGIELRLLEGKTSELNQAALEGKCDFSLTYRAADTADLSNIKLYEEEVYVALPLNNPLVKKLGLTYGQEEIPTVEAKDLANNKIIGMKKGQSLRSIFRKLNRLTGDRLETIVETDSMFLAKKFVTEGLGISLIPAGMALDNKLDCIFVKTDPALDSRMIMIHYNSSRRLRKPAQILIKMLKDYVKDNIS